MAIDFSPAPLVASGLDPKRLPPQPGSVAGMGPGVVKFLAMGVDVR